MKTCAAGCHEYRNGEWWEESNMEWVLCDFPYCFASHAELLPGGEVREMVALEVAVSHIATGGNSCNGCTMACGSDACREALREHLRAQAKEMKP